MSEQNAFVLSLTRLIWCLNTWYILYVWSTFVYLADIQPSEQKEPVTRLFVSVWSI